LLIGGAELEAADGVAEIALSDELGLGGLPTELCAGLKFFGHSGSDLVEPGFGLRPQQDCAGSHVRHPALNSLLGCGLSKVAVRLHQDTGIPVGSESGERKRTEKSD
jgi:hypothetical protein